MRLVPFIAVLSSLAFAQVASAADTFTPVTVQPVGASTMPVRGTDRPFHVVYELELTNANLAPATLNSLQVLDVQKPSRVLANYAGPSLVARLRTLVPTPAQDAALEPNGSRFLFVELAFASRAAVPDRVVHRVSVLAAANPGATEP